MLRSIEANELDRSPAVQVVTPSDEDVAQLLQKAGKSADDPLTPELARQLCETKKGRFFTDGEIKPQGDGYVLDLSVRECKSGTTVAQQQRAAKNKDEVMQAASQLAAAIRLQLSGNSASSSGSAPAPLPSSSVQAFRAFLLGDKLYETQHKQSAAMLSIATQLDPNFAQAWALLAHADYNLQETNRAADDISHAFALRAKLPDDETASVEARYYTDVTAELYKAIEVTQTWEKLQPNEFEPHNLLGGVYSDLGMYEKATVEYRKNIDLFPNFPHAISNLTVILCAQGCYDEAATLLQQIRESQKIGFHDHRERYRVAMLRSDQAAREKERTWMEPNADEPSAISFLAGIDLYEGRLETARQRTQHGVSVSVQSGMSETASHMLIDLARGEALYGEGARRQTNARPGVEAVRF